MCVCVCVCVCVPPRGSCADYTRLLKVNRLVLSFQVHWNAYRQGMSDGLGI